MFISIQAAPSPQYAICLRNAKKLRDMFLTEYLWSIPLTT
jgi:hypothetical protein